MTPTDAVGWLYLQQSSKYSLAKKTVIQQLLSGLLLLVFTFSIAPRQFLHDAIANHTDKRYSVLPANGHQVSKTGFFCKCDDLVAESPFTDDVQQYSIVSPRSFSVQAPVALYFFYSSPVFFFALRGPPAAGSSLRPSEILS